MKLSSDQVKKLISVVAQTSPDALDCDGCLSHVAEFADAKLTGKTTCESMQAVQAHLENCPCCEHEFQMLVEALRALEGGPCGNQRPVDPDSI